MAEEEVEFVSLETLRSKSQVIEHSTPGNIVRNMTCSVCDGHYTCTSDFKLHLTGEFHKKAVSNPKNRSAGKLSPNDLDRLPWKVFRSGKGWWIYSEEAPYLQEFIRNGHNIIGKYNYYLYGGNKCIGRSLHSG